MPRFIFCFWLIGQQRIIGWAAARLGLISGHDTPDFNALRYLFLDGPLIYKFHSRARQRRGQQPAPRFAKRPARCRYFSGQGAARCLLRLCRAHLEIISFHLLLIFKIIWQWHGLSKNLYAFTYSDYFLPQSFIRCFTPGYFLLHSYAGSMRASLTTTGLISASILTCQ